MTDFRQQPHKHIEVFFAYRFTDPVLYHHNSWFIDSGCLVLSFTLKIVILCFTSTVQRWFLLCFLVLFVHIPVVRYTVHTEVLPSIWLNSPCSSVAWLLGGVRRVIRPSEHLLTAAWRHCLRAAVRLWSVTDLVLSRSLFLLIFSTNLWFMINSGSAFQRYYTLDSMTLKRYSLTLSCIVLYAVLPIL